MGWMGLDLDPVRGGFYLSFFDEADAGARPDLRRECTVKRILGGMAEVWLREGRVACIASDFGRGGLALHGFRRDGVHRTGEYLPFDGPAWSCPLERMRIHQSEEAGLAIWFATNGRLPRTYWKEARVLAGAVTVWLGRRRVPVAASSPLPPITGIALRPDSLGAPLPLAGVNLTYFDCKA